jgi:hypothetical protein
MATVAANKHVPKKRVVDILDPPPIVYPKRPSWKAPAAADFAVAVASTIPAPRQPRRAGREFA